MSMGIKLHIEKNTKISFSKLMEVTFKILLPLFWTKTV
jgi:hypothetical protein